MKKCLSIVLAVFLLLMFAGCEGLDRKSNSQQTTKSTQADSGKSTTAAYENDIPDCCGE